MQIGKWKHACRIDFDLTKIAVYADDTFLFPNDTSIAGGNSNNRYLTNEETKMRFQFETLHFIPAMLRYVAAMY